MAIISKGYINGINGDGKPLNLIELDDSIYINTSKYNKYSLSPIPFEFLKINQNITTYYDYGPFMGMSINKTCNLFHSQKSHIKRTAKGDCFGGYIRDSANMDYLYFINNRSYTSDMSIIYKIDLKDMRIISKLNVENSISFAGQDDEYIYIYNLNGHTDSINGIYIYKKANNTIILKDYESSTFSYDILYQNYYFSGFTYMDNSNEKEVHIINTKGYHLGKSNNGKSIIARYGNTSSQEIIYDLYNKTESPDTSIQDFNNVNFHVKGYTRFSKFSDVQIFIPFFSYRESDRKKDGDTKVLKFLSILKDNSTSQCSFYKEYSIDISEYLNNDNSFIIAFDKIIDSLYNRNLDINIEYIDISDKKYMVTMFTNNSNNSINSNLSGIMVWDIDIDTIKLISYTPNKFNRSWDGHIFTSDIKQIYQGTYSDGITVYKLDESKKKYECLTFKSIPYLVEIGLDISENLYTLNKYGEIKRISNFDTIIVDIKLEKSSYIKNEENKETFVLVTSKNIKGEILKNIITLKITGNAKFNNDKQTIEITGGENIKVPIIITGFGKFKVSHIE